MAACLRDECPTGLARPDRAALPRVHEARERAIAALSDHSRTTRWTSTSSSAGLRVAHTSDSPPTSRRCSTCRSPAVHHRAGQATVAAGAGRARRLAPETVYAIFGGIDRRGTWNVPRRMRVVAIFGGADLDLREARFPPGVIDIEVTAVMGGINISCRPGWRSRCTARRSWAASRTSTARPPTPIRTRRCCACTASRSWAAWTSGCGLPGESERDARRRRTGASFVKNGASSVASGSETRRHQRAHRSSCATSGRRSCI